MRCPSCGNDLTKEELAEVSQYRVCVECYKIQLLTKARKNDPQQALEFELSLKRNDQLLFPL